MDKNKLIKEVMKDLVENHSDLIKESINRILKEEEEESEEEFERQILKIIDTFSNCFDRYNISIMSSSHHVDYKKYIGNVVNGFLIPKKDDCKDSNDWDIFTKIIKYPFRIVDANKDAITLLGLSPIKDTKWEKCKDNGYKFAFDLSFSREPEESSLFIAEGHIPSKEEIESIPDENLRAIGIYYWTSTPYEDGFSYAWYVTNGGDVNGNGLIVSCILGVVPYIVIDLNTIKRS